MERLPLFDDNFSRKILRPHIQHIADTVVEHVSEIRQPGWMTGLAGMGVFLAEYGDWAENHNTDILQRIVNIIDDGFTFPTLAAGLTGILFAFQYLGKRKLIDADDAHALDELIPFLEKHAKHEIENGNLDPLHGGLGLSMIDVARAGQRACPSLGPADPHACPYDSKSNIDLGLAHGLPSYLLHLSKTANESSSTSTTQLQHYLNILISHADLTQKQGSVFPTKIIDGKPQYPSRLAWCYGDVGVGMALLLLGKELGEEVLELAAERRDFLNTRVEDPFLCHGSSGLALIFYKAWLLSKNDKLLDAAKYWTQETLNYLNASFLPNKSSNLTLLNGLSGIGLVLLALDQGFLPGWEKGILL